MSERDPRRTVALVSALGLALMLAVILAAAGIRLDTGIPGLRIVHRAAASLEVLVVLWLGWMAWRRPPVQLAIALTALLSVVGILGGQSPPPAIAAINLLGGLALAALFAWMLGKSGSEPDFRCISATANGNRALTPIFLLLAVQLGLGAWLSIVERFSVALQIHGLLAVALTAALIWVARARAVFLALALAAPIAGFTALHFEYSAAAPLVHAATAALLCVSTAYALAASLDPYQGNARRGRHSAGHE